MSKKDRVFRIIGRVIDYLPVTALAGCASRRGTRTSFSTTWLAGPIRRVLLKIEFDESYFKELFSIAVAFLPSFSAGQPGP